MFRSHGREGKHLFAGREYPFLRTLGYYPQDDGLPACPERPLFEPAERHQG